MERKVLSNGMTVVFKKRDNGVVALSFSVRHGAANELAKDKGISHFIEHMLYKGTKKRNALQISSEIEKNGGELNGFTSEQVTSFWCKIPSNHLDVALDVLSDMVKNPVFDEGELNKERQVIFEEMKMYYDTPQLHVFDKIKSTLYEGDFALPIIGSVKSMMSNNQDKLRKFFKKIYVPSNMVLTVVGDADFSKICDFAEKNFGKGPLRKETVKIKPINREEIEKRKGINQTNLILAFHIPKANDKKYYAAEVLMALMGGGMSSRLFTEIREKRNLAYAVKAFTECEKDYAYSGIYVGTTPKNLEPVKKIILEEFDKVSTSVSEEELEQIKEQIVGHYLISKEDSSHLLTELLFSEIKGNAKDAEKYVEMIKAVRVEDVKELAKLKKFSFFALVPEDS